MVAAWTVRARLADLSLGETVGFTRATLVENYNQPDRLVLEGREEDLAPVMAPGDGIVVYGGDGSLKFSGWTTDPIERRDDGTATVGFTGDLVLLWDRRCWPDPGNAWTEQAVEKHTVTGPEETRLLTYINANAGPGAYHSAALATPVGGFTTYLTLTPKDRNMIGQAIAVDPTNGDIYLTQVPNNNDDGRNDVDDLFISRFNAAGVYKSTMYVTDGGHGDQLIISRKGKAVHCTFRYRGLSGSHDVSGRWVTVPYSPSRKWTAKTIRKYTSSGPRMTKPLRRGWWQGEARYGGRWYRLYGTPYTASGPTGQAMPASIEVIEDGAIVSTIDASALGRDGSGNPIGGRLEPEGLTVSRYGTPVLLVGIAIGFKGAYQHRLYSYPLTAAPPGGEDEPEDRRVPGLRVPTSLGRGPVGTSFVRFDNLGEVVARIAERASLRVQVKQDYDPDGTPHLDVVVTDAPDLTSTVRLGTPQSSGPTILDRGWRHTVHPPTATVVLSAAGGTGAARKLSVVRDEQAGQRWSRRIETLLDQQGTTDDAEIAEGLGTAMAEAGESVEVVAPLATESGVTVPVGATVSAIVSGLHVADRVRRITTELEGSRVKVTPTIGHPEQPLTIRKARAVEKRLTNLETKR